MMACLKMQVSYEKLCPKSDPFEAGPISTSLAHGQWNCVYTENFDDLAVLENASKRMQFRLNVTRHLQ